MADAAWQEDNKMALLSKINHPDTFSAPVGALAGFVAPSAIGLAKDRTGHYTLGLLLVAASLAGSAALVLALPQAVDGVLLEAATPTPVPDAAAAA